MNVNYAHPKATEASVKSVFSTNPEKTIHSRNRDTVRSYEQLHTTASVI